MLDALGVSRVALLSNNPDKARQLRSCGVTVVEQVSTGVYLSASNHRYLETKAHRGRHTLELPNVLRARSSESRLAQPGAAALP
jgi:GTP cyclohydrolase II